MLKLCKTTSPKKLFDYDCVTHSFIYMIYTANLKAHNSKADKFHFAAHKELIEKRFFGSSSLTKYKNSRSTSVDSALRRFLLNYTLLGCN